MATLSRANTTAQWYADNYPGGEMSWLDKFLLHSTETKSWPGYGGGASAPNATYHPLKREIRQHFPNTMSARALRDPSGTAVRENRDHVFQLEIIAYSDYKLAQSVGGLWIGDLTDTHMRDIAQMINELGVPAKSTVQWREGQKTYVSGVRLSGPSYDAYKGILAHMHASGNDHWDVGGFRYSKLAAALNVTPPDTGGDDLPTPAEVWDYENQNVMKGDVYGILVEAYRKADYATKQLNSVAAGVSALAAALRDADVLSTEQVNAVNKELAGGGKPGLSY